LSTATACANTWKSKASNSSARTAKDAKGKQQDGRALRRYRQRWKIERTFAWLSNFRRLVVR
jgi:transposase